MRYKTLNIITKNESDDHDVVCTAEECGSLEVTYYNRDDDSYWLIRCHELVAYKVTDDAFRNYKHVEELPVSGTCFEIIDSPWKVELKDRVPRPLEGYRHYAFQFG